MTTWQHNIRSTCGEDLRARGRFHRLLPHVSAVFLIGLISLSTRAAVGQSDATGPQEVLRLFGFDTSTMRQFNDGQPLHPDEFEPIYRVLYLLPRLEPIDVFRWRRPLDQVASIGEQAEAARGRLYHLQGWVTSIEQTELPTESVQRFDYERFFQVRMNSSAGGQRFVICARNIPKAWQEHLMGAADLQLPASCDAMFLKLGQVDETEGSTADEYVFATQHVAWHANELERTLGINSGKALLGRAGMDVGRFDTLEQERAIGYGDRECFYQMLWALARLDPMATQAQAETEYDIAKLLKEPETQAGQFYNLHGLARRAIRVLVEDADIQAKYGIDHYYEVDVFLPLSRTLTLVDPKDGHARQYQTYPVTFCVRRLPDDMPIGPSIRQEVQICGSYMKLWSYRSRFVAEPESNANQPRRRQRSPLLIASTAKIVVTKREPDRWPELALVGGFLTAIVVIGIAAWLYALGDRAFAARHRHRPDQIPGDLP